jgi:hypothetical protein
MNKNMTAKQLLNFKSWLSFCNKISEKRAVLSFGKYLGDFAIEIRNKTITEIDVRKILRKKFGNNKEFFIRDKNFCLAQSIKGNHSFLKKDAPMVFPI